MEKHTAHLFPGKDGLLIFFVGLMCETKESSSVMIFGRGLLNKLVFGPHAELRDTTNSQRDWLVEINLY